MICPVCQKEGLSEKLTTCPQCNSDLQCFQWLDDLHESPQPIPLKTAHPEKHLDLSALQATLHKQWIITTGILLLTIILLWLLQPIAWQTDKKNPHLADTQIIHQDNPEIMANIRLILQQLQQTKQQLMLIAQQPAMKSPPPLAKSSQTPAILLYQSHPHETLWAIAKRYYHKGSLYPVLLATNPGLSVFHHPQYGKIKILQDQQAVERIYKKSVYQKNGHWYFRYYVMTADSWQTISRRFYGNVDHVAQIKALNPMRSLQKNMEIIIPLGND